MGYVGSDLFPLGKPCARRFNWTMEHLTVAARIAWRGAEYDHGACVGEAMGAEAEKLARVPGGKVDEEWEDG